MYLERLIEEEKNVEKEYIKELENPTQSQSSDNKTKETANSIETKEDLIELIERDINSYNIILELESEDITEALKFIMQNLKELIDIGRKQFNLSTEEINNLLTPINEEHKNHLK